jgi:hypothetical protein
MLIVKAVQVTSFKIEHSSPFTGDPAPTVNRHTTSAFAGTHTLTVVTFSREVFKLRPAHHLMS